jgi:hypothetical protein
MGTESPNRAQTGDAWDRQIRKQIHDCALFIPLISQPGPEVVPALAGQTLGDAAG